MTGHREIIFRFSGRSGRSTTFNLNGDRNATRCRRITQPSWYDPEYVRINQTERITRRLLLLLKRGANTRLPLCETNVITTITSQYDENAIDVRRLLCNARRTHAPTTNFVRHARDDYRKSRARMKMEREGRFFTYPNRKRFSSFSPPHGGK